MFTRMSDMSDVMGGNAINSERKAGFSVRGVGSVYCLLETMVCECCLFSLYIHTQTHTHQLKTLAF